MSFLSLVKGTIELKDVIKWNLKSRIRGEVPTKPYKMGEKMVILGNGLSQKLFWENKKDFDDYDILTMNSFPYRAKKEFFEIKPKYYCAIDPVLFDRERAEKAGELMDYEGIREELQKVDWEMYLITWTGVSFKINNTQIKEIHLAKPICESVNEKIKYKLSLKNFTVLRAETFALPSILFAIIFGYREVALFGIDNDTFKQIRFNEHGKIVGETWHSYDDQKADTYMLRDDPDGNHFIYEIFEGYMWMFKEYIYLHELAEYAKCNIVNFNQNSYCDAFDKNGKYMQLKPEEKVR